ncbi:hypothetical protein QBC46DRAFT_373206 [Diplogelasinospora grovesii]|uniref:Uncharacterized protein n=1 Tax=Diplogelasinospora grovesii TaxID=303347 RepID=A0AAN6NJG0_9PEZI|nr:hypothetical protein QBC46DRAFT_373206 [Diplogelasinospora grovesii]
MLPEWSSKAIYPSLSFIVIWYGDPLVTPPPLLLRPPFVSILALLIHIPHPSSFVLMYLGFLPP